MNIILAGINKNVIVYLFGLYTAKTYKYSFESQQPWAKDGSLKSSRFLNLLCWWVSSNIGINL
jgi:hypothetical protein